MHSATHTSRYTIILTAYPSIHAFKLTCPNPLPTGADRFLAQCLQELQIHQHTSSCGLPQPCTAEYPRAMIEQSQVLQPPHFQQPLLLQRRDHPFLVNSNSTLMKIQPMNQAIYCLAEQSRALAQAQRTHNYSTVGSIEAEALLAAEYTSKYSTKYSVHSLNEALLHGYSQLGEAQERVQGMR